jgi:hypothetical protein
MKTSIMTIAVAMAMFAGTAAYATEITVADVCTPTQIERQPKMCNRMLKEKQEATKYRLGFAFSGMDAGIVPGGIGAGSGSGFAL